MAEGAGDPGAVTKSASSLDNPCSICVRTIINSVSRRNFCCLLDKVWSVLINLPSFETDFFQTWYLLRIVPERRVMKSFVAIKFKQKWMMPFCSQTHLALDWYWTLRPLRSIYDCRIGWWTSAILISLAEIFRVFCSRQKSKCQVWKKIVLFDPFDGRILVELDDAYQYSFNQFEWYTPLSFTLKINCCIAKLEYYVGQQVRQMMPTEELIPLWKYDWKLSSWCWVSSQICKNKKRLIF